jgi:cytochrome c oxidase cbb3-type subunit I/II
MDASGHLVYPDFVETVTKIVPLYYVRAVGGLMFLVGSLIMVYNLFKTIQTAAADLSDEVAEAPPLKTHTEKEKPHRMLEGMPVLFTALTLLAVIVGTVIELVPTFVMDEYIPKDAKIKPYTALELHGRDIYIREGCYNCHSQMIRPMESEVIRYGNYSRLEESMYDHPFQWGSKRTGPDLARIGGKYPDLWHLRHMLDPREVVPGSIMPSYSWLGTDRANYSMLQKKLNVMSALGVPYTDKEIETAVADAIFQAKTIAENMEAQGAPKGLADKEIISMIAYLQRLGKNNIPKVDSK